jgi:Terminase small subunit
MKRVSLSDPLRSRKRVSLKGDGLDGRQATGALNHKQRKFAEEYLIDLNATQAAIRSGYAAKTAYSSGERLLRHAEVSKAIAQAQAELSERTKITQERVLTEIGKIAFANLKEWEKVPHKLNAKLNALIQAGKHVGLFTDKLQVESRNLTVTVTPADLAAARELVMDRLPTIEHLKDE